jgi:hypothetical protein
MSWRGALALVVLTLGGCGTPTVGLRPAYPPTPGEPKKLEGPEFLKTSWSWWVDSVRPTLEWETFPRESDARHKRERIRNVMYDLRVWRALHANNVKEVVIVDLVYSRDGLTASRHRLEEPLLHAAEYVWTVRARYDLDGGPRATPWSGLAEQARLPIEPSPWRYRFTTPKQ